MGFTVASLTNYVNEQSDKLLTALQFEGETAKYANIITGIKSSQALQILTNAPFPQNGDSCAFNASGGSTFTQRNISTSAIKFQDSFCPRDLQAKWTQMLLKAGQHYDESDIPRVIIEDTVAQIKARTETMDWQGNTAVTSNGYIKHYDGFATIIKAASGTNVATAVSGPVTTSNVRTIMQNIVAKIGTVAVLVGNPKVKIFCGYDIADLYRQKVFIDNLYHVTGQGAQKGLMAEGSVHEIVPVHGLDGLGSNSGDNPFIFALDPDRNLYIGCDMENEQEDARMWVDGSDNETVKYSFRYRRGCQIAFPSEIVEYSNS